MKSLVQNPIKLAYSSTIIRLVAVIYVLLNAMAALAQSTAPISLDLSTWVPFGDFSHPTGAAFGYEDPNTVLYYGSPVSIAAADNTGGTATLEKAGGTIVSIDTVNQSDDEIYGEGFNLGVEPIVAGSFSMTITYQLDGEVDVGYQPHAECLYSDSVINLLVHIPINPGETKTFLVGDGVNSVSCVNYNPGARGQLILSNLTLNPSTTPPPSCGNLQATPLVNGITPSNLEADGNPSVGINAAETISVNVNATGVRSNCSPVVPVSLTWPTQVGGPITQNATFNANGTVNVQLPAIFQAADAGSQILTITVDPAGSFGGPFITQQKLWVLCDVAQLGVNVPFFSQAQTAPTNWAADPFGPLGAGFNPKHTMQQYGCYLTNIDMVLNTTSSTPNTSNYDILNTVSGLYIPVGAEISSSASGLVSLTPGALNDASKVEIFNGHYTMFDANNDPDAQGIVNYARLAYGATCAKNGGSIADCSAKMLSQISYKPGQIAYSQTSVQQQICAGNPVILSLAIPANGKKPAHSHFVLATAMSVDPSGKPSYIVNDPGTGKGQKTTLYKSFPPSTNPINGQRLFANSADPSFFQVDATSQGTSYVVTDSQGRMTGFNPITNQSYSQIPGAVYYSDFSPNEDPTSTTPDQLPSQIFYSGNAAAGAFTIDVYSAKGSTAQLQVTGYDNNGQINQIQPISQAVDKNGHAKVTYQHTTQSLLVGKLDFKHIRRLDKGRDHDFGLLLEGKIVLPTGAVYADLTRSFSLSIGTYSKSFQASDFKSISHHGDIEYILRDQYRDGISVKFKNDGHFLVKIRDLDLTAEALKVPIQVDIQVDSLHASDQINIKQRCDDEGKK